MVFTNDGCNVIRDWLAGDSATAPTYVAVGSDSTTPDKTDTTLGTELSRWAYDSVTTEDKKAIFEGFVANTDLNGNDLKEVGLFNASSAGTMFVRAAHATISKTTYIEVQYTITVQVTN